ncbi:MAG: DUF3179 domain-containing (seleno)protein [Fuerstiella sp.]
MIRHFTLVASVLVSVSTGCGDPSAEIPDDGMDEKLNAAMQNTPFITPGITHTAMQPSDPTEASDDEPVLGIVVDGEARAYSVTAMSSISAHVVNDLVGNTPVSITWCDRTNCARAFTADTPGQPIPLSVGGFVDDEMSLLFENRMYPQTSPEIPLQDYDVEVTTWGQWVNQHPNSKVFLKLQPDPEPEAAGNEIENKNEEGAGEGE